MKGSVASSGIALKWTYFEHVTVSCLLCTSPVCVGENGMPSSCTFNDRWLENARYKTWFKRRPNPQAGSCNICIKDLQLFMMGESMLSSG
ncbi:hypothetical protein ILYODFUR_025452 [Ilyodon furcidens]|uniref:Uncharacterized protein n=1 Tax=Ilyodon furcidens TaxID=33524 RepID=A0ABV0TXL8_9TELE